MSKSKRTMRARLLYYPLGNWEHGKKVELWYQSNVTNQVVGCYRFSRALRLKDSRFYHDRGTIIKHMTKQSPYCFHILLTDEEFTQISNHGTKASRVLILKKLLENKESIDESRPRPVIKYKHSFRANPRDREEIIQAHTPLDLDHYRIKNKPFKRYYHVGTYKSYEYREPSLIKKDKRVKIDSKQDTDWLEVGLFSKHVKIIKELKGATK